MENQNNQINNIGKLKSKFWKFTLMFFAVVIGIFVLYVAGMWAFKAYQQWQGEKRVENLAQALKQFEADDYAKAMADTYGGKTPQETLQMYIDAVEKGDYELASKYFIGDKQEEELMSFDGASKENINNMLNVLRRVEIVDLRKQLEQMYDDEMKQYNLDEAKEDYVNRLYDVWDYDKKAFMKTKVDGYDFSVDFKKYPNGIWKIIEI